MIDIKTKYQIPSLIKKLFPNIMPNQLNLIEKNMIYKTQKISVCETCYL